MLDPLVIFDPIVMFDPLVMFDPRVILDPFFMRESRTYFILGRVSSRPFKPKSKSGS